MRVILATGIEEIDAGVREKLSAEKRAEMLKECYYREGVLPLAKGKRAEVVVISPHLPGQTEMIELIKEIRKADMRVVFLPGREDDRRAVEMGNKAAAHGVYDIAWDPVSVDEVVKLILNPNTYSRAGARPDEESVNVFKEKASKKSVLNFFLRKRNGKAEYDKKEELAETCTVEEDFQRVGEFDSSPAAFPEKQRIPEDFAVLGSEEFPSVHELCAALPGNYSAVVVPAGWPGLADAIRELRRNPAAPSLPIVVVGPCNAEECYAAGADECVENLTETEAEQIRAKSERIRNFNSATDRRKEKMSFWNKLFKKNSISEEPRAPAVHGWPDLSRPVQPAVNYAHEEDASANFPGIGSARIPDRPPPVLLLMGKRAESLSGRAKERGFVPVTPNSRPGVRPDAAVVDVELATSASGLGCRTIILSAGKFSDLLLASGDTLVALNGEAALDFAEKACRPGVAESAFPPQDIYTGARPGAAAFRQYPGQEASVKRADDGSRGPAKVPKRGLVLAFYSGTQAQQGKTSLAVNSAALLASRKMSVCLVDLDTSKAGLTRLVGYSEHNRPGCDLESFFGGAPPASGPAGTRFVAVPLPEREWFLDTRQVEELISGLAGVFDAVILDFGVRLVTPPVKTAFRHCDRIFVVTLPHRMSASAVARLRGQWLADVGSGRVAVVVNRVGFPNANLSPRDAAGLLGFGAYYEVPEDPAVAAAEDEAARGKPYNPPCLGKKSRLGKALAAALDGVVLNKGGVRFVE